MVATKNKEYLFTDDATYNLYLKKEQKILINYKELRKIASSCLGLNSINDCEVFLGDPIEFLINSYWKKYASKYLPAHSNKRQAFLSNNTVNLNTITNLQKEIKSLVKEMQHHAPTIGKNGLKSNLKEESFFKFLNPNRKSEYEALQAFVTASNRLMSDYGASGSVNLLRFANGLKFDGSRIAIDAYKFI